MLGYPEQSAEDFAKLREVPRTASEIIDLEYIEPHDKALLEYAFETTQLIEDEATNVLPHEDDIIPLFKKYGPELGLSPQEIEVLCEKIPLSLQQHSFNINTIRWRDYRHSEESTRKQERLKAAFSLSGI